MDRRTVSELDFERLGAAFSKLRKQSINLLRQKKQPTFGICFDCDGVLARGTIPIKAAQRAFKRLVDDRGQFLVPVAFVTNSLNKNADKAKIIGEWFDVEVTPDQMVQAQGPLEMFTEFHNKHCLLIGQGKITEIAKELGFKKFCTIEDVVEAYPLLDMVDHDNRRKVAQEPIIEKSLPRIEGMLRLLAHHSTDPDLLLSLCSCHSVRRAKKMGILPAVDCRPAQDKRQTRPFAQVRP
jgi:HAD superfamily hydrolase (TIGR01456 family)